MFAGKALRCDCGYELKARGEEEQVAEVRRHALKAHGVAFSAEEALVVLLRSELESSEESSLHGGREGDR
jgi:predicted small metal-binding protein